MTREQIAELRRMANRDGYAAPVDKSGKFGDAVIRLLDEREALLNALKAAADKLLWANSNLMHSWAQEQPCDHEAAEEADEGEKAARAAIAKAEAE